MLLDAGAAHVVALDVGHDQLHRRLRNNGRISNLEGFNARDLDANLVEEHGGITRLVSDVSFISVTKALDPALRHLPRSAQALVLVKPQFEVGRDGLQKDGVAKDPASALQLVQDWLATQHTDWSIAWQGDSPLYGGDGNRAFLMHLGRV